MSDEKPKFGKCNDCKKDIEWKPSLNGNGKNWPFDIGSAVPHFQTCANKKPFISKCKYCSGEIEWKDRKPFNKDNTQHNCKPPAATPRSFDDTEPLF